MNPIEFVIFFMIQYVICQNCKPFGVRLNFGTYFYNFSSTEKLAIRFDTKSACQKSFVTIQKNKQSITKIFCDSSRLEFQSYGTYIHKCSIVDLKQADNIQYMVFGWTGNSSDPQIPYLQNQISYHFPSRYQQFKIINVADWGYLRELRDKYKPLDTSFDYLLRNDPNIRGLFINGDMAYDLQSNNGRNYQDFLNMISQVTIRWPLIINPGNHEHRDNNSYIMARCFQTYNIVNNNVVQLRFPWFNFILFDPYQILYKGQPESLIYPNFSKQIKQAYESKNLTILASHYPFRCNGIPSDCVTKHQRISTFFSSMFEVNVPLYLGAHHHAYQRHFPFKQDGTYIKNQRTVWSVQSTPQQRYLVSIVEGVGGTDAEIVQSYDSLQDFTAAVSYNVTGFGILTVNQNILRYNHYTTNSASRPNDQVQIILRRRPRKKLRSQ